MTKLIASDGESANFFGQGVAISGNRAVVGAYRKTNKKGAECTEFSCFGSGAVYVYDLHGTEIAKLTHSDEQYMDNLGFNVAIDGDYIVAGAHGMKTQSGAAYIFDKDGTELVKLTPSDPAEHAYFGKSVAISGKHVVVGAYGKKDRGMMTGAAYIFTTDGTQIAKLLPAEANSGDMFGTSVAISGNLVVVSSPGSEKPIYNAGAVFVFDLAQGGKQIAKLLPSDAASHDKFGGDVAIDGDRIVVGAHMNRGPNNEYGEGSAYIFSTSGQQIAKLTAPDGNHRDMFGHSVSISGDRIIVGSMGEDDHAVDSGSAYLFDTSGNLLKKLKAPDAERQDYFGISVAISGDHAVIGAFTADEHGTNTNSGAAYLASVN